jgi:hypothetical protein
MVSVCAGLANGSGVNPGDPKGFVPGASDCHSGLAAPAGSSQARSASYVDAAVSTDLHATGQAEYGRIRLMSDSAAPATVMFPLARAVGGWVDQWRIDPLDPSLAGKPATLGMNLHVDGTLSATGPNAGASMQLAAYVDNQTSFPQGGYRVSGQGFFNQPYQQSVDTTVTLQVAINLGQPFKLGVFADAASGPASSSADPRPNLGHVDFANTITWQGIAGVSVGGQAIDYSLTAASGIDWSQPYVAAVPEPGSWALMAGGLTVGAWLCRRRAARA